MSSIVFYAVPFFLLTLGLEILALRKRRDLAGYESADTIASLCLGVGNVLVSALVKTAVVPLYFWASTLSPFEIEATAGAFVFLFIAEDFCYYWFHRVGHESRLFWAAHVNHHSSTRFNLSTALRQSLTTPVTGFVFWLPLALIGFAPEQIALAQGVSLIYQFWLHTELIGRLGPFERLFNTPSHHRVHHGRNPQYLDRNYAGILIVWDKLFGTFEPEREAVDYGLTKNLERHDPWTIAFHEWQGMLADLFRATNLREALGVVFRRPGWRADGTGRTACDLRAEYEAALGGTAVPEG